MKISGLIPAIITAVQITAFSHFALASNESGDGPQVKTAQGQLQGSRDGDIFIYKGIPYAKAPIGKNRWRSPQPLAAWEGVKQATAYGHDCMQKPFPGDAAPLGEVPGEDCLYLNVWAPADVSGKAPVAVWIHGGGLVNGGSSPATYSGHKFARAGVIFVSFNYRLGRFGFFAHPALSNAGEGPVGNYGFQDQIAALTWIRQHIAAFGGNPENVTVIGESAGGRSVHMLMQTPLAEGLFQRAVIMSGGGRGLMSARPLTQSTNGQPSAEQMGLNFAKKHGITGPDDEVLSALRALPAERVVDGLNLASLSSPPEGPPTYSGAILDGEVVVGHTEQLLKAGRFAKMPVMVGTTSADLGTVAFKDKSALIDSFGDYDGEAIEAYDPFGTRPFDMVAAEVGQDRDMQEPARYVAQQVTRQGHPAYLYRFGYVAQSRQDGAGAPHASEIPFFFDTVDIKYPDATKTDLAAGVQAFRYLVNFVKSGDPDTGMLPLWSPYNDDEHNIMLFKMSGEAQQVTDPWTKRLDAVAGAAMAKD